ncbi:MAG: sulfurtransferase [candidate division Zixibacteria bacterium]|nr:sulfurtransferase [candidate division Zixibacteria bacterium]
MKKAVGLCLIIICTLYATVSATERQIFVTPQWVAERLNKSEYVILEVALLKADYAREHIPGSRFLWQWSISESTMERQSEPLPVPVLDSVLKQVGVNNDSKIILSYMLGDGGAAARVYVVLDWLGLGDRTYILNGGFEAWKAAGLPTTREIPTVRKGDFTPILHPEVFADLDYVTSHYRSDGVRMIDSRTPTGFNQTGGVNVYRGGHIPGAVNIPFTVLVDSTNHFRPPDSVNLKVLGAGIRPTDEVIAYCWSGGTACRLYVALKSLGYRVRLYDGSFEEWCRIDSLPVEFTPPKTEEKPKGN